MEKMVSRLINNNKQTHRKKENSNVNNKGRKVHVPAKKPKTRTTKITSM